MKTWTEEELDILLTHLGTMPLKGIAKKIGRTTQAIESKLARMGIYGSKSNTDRLTVYQLAEALCVDNHTVYRWIKNKNLPYKKYVVLHERSFIMIKVSSFWKWAEQNQSLINFAKVPKNSLPPEPDWVEGKRKSDYDNIPAKKHQYWTPEEDARLRSLYYGQGLTQAEIAKIMGRSRHGVQRRLSRIVKASRSAS